MFFFYSLIFYIPFIHLAFFFFFLISIIHLLFCILYFVFFFLTRKGKKKKSYYFLSSHNFPSLFGISDFFVLRQPVKIYCLFFMIA